jgi:hypothetical protein
MAVDSNGRAAGGRPTPSAVEATAGVVGIVMIFIGVSGFFGFGLAGNPDTHPIFITGMIRDLTNIIIGSLGLYVALGLKGRNAAIGLVLLGALFLALLIVSLNSDDLYGLLQNTLNTADHGLDLFMALVCFAVGGWALVRRTPAVATA